MNEDGAAVVRLTDTATKAQARSLIVDFLTVQGLRHGIEDVNAVGTLQMKFRPADYSFVQLYQWHKKVSPVLLRYRTVTMTDVDEVKNRVVVGVSTTDEVGVLLAVIDQLGVPREAVETKIVSPVEIEQSLNDVVRPIIGGTQIEDCTLTYNVAHTFTDGTLDPDEYFLTAAHCTDVFGTSTGMPIGQATSADVIGHEYVDPPLFTDSEDPSCPYGRKCRYSDAALFIHQSVDYSHGYVAWPPPNSTVFSEQKVISGAGDPIVGLVVHKIGSRSGRTHGTVSETCAPYKQFRNGVDTGRTMLCQNRADYHSVEGDSGSPVLQLMSDGTTVDRGIHWGSGGLFSSPNLWNQEIRFVMGGGLGATINSR